MAARPAAPAAAPAAAAWPCLQPDPAQPGRCRLDLSVQPNAKRTQADGLHDGALRLRLAAPPVDGKANAALLAWLADELGCPRRDLALLRGETGRRKLLQVARPAAEVAAWLARVLAPPG